MRYRTRNEIALCILASAKERKGITRMQLMFYAYLSFTQLKEFLLLLTEKGLLEFDAHTSTYHITIKGDRLLGSYQVLK
ncbi:MAG: winged helix-turn-helix domain-containing protein [Thermoproteota archaeon]